MRLYDNDTYRDRFIELVYMELMYGAATDCASQIIVAFDSIPSVEAEPLLPNGPLTLEELREMDGEPVWVERNDGAQSRWVIVGDFESLYGVYFGTAVGGMRLPYEEYGKTWLAYRCRPEGVIFHRKAGGKHL